MFISGLQMSVEGVPNNSDQNSGEIKVGFCEDTMIIDNSDNDSSMVLMGYSAEGVTSDVEPVNLFCKQIGESIDENAVIFNDMRSVEDWLRNRTDLVDYDTSIRNDYLCFSSDAISGSNISLAERTISPTVSNDTPIAEDGVCNVTWDDLVLDSDGGVLRNRNNILILDSQSKSNCGLDLNSKSVVSDLGPTVSHKTHTANIPLQTITDKEISLDSEPIKQVVTLSSENTAQGSNERSAKCMSKSLPFIKISKNCLMKGKILGKGDISLLSGNSPISFLSSQTTLISGIKDANIARSKQILNYPDVRKKEDSNTLAEKGLVNLHSTKVLNNSNSDDNEKTIVKVPISIPVRSAKPNRNRSLTSKPSNSRSILKNSISNKSVTSTNSSSTAICETLDSKASKNQNGDPVALVAISTNKVDDSTEIIIKTEDGENVYKGKTSDIMKATNSANIKYKVNFSEKNKKGVVRHDDVSINEVIMKLFGVTVEVLDHYDGTPTQTHLMCPIDTCKYNTMKGALLKVHVLHHYRIRPYKCHYPGCTWAFYTNFRLKRHQGIHYEKKEYRCPIEDCGRTFTTAYNVNSHLKLHNRPFTVTCGIDECNRSFQTRKSYEKHLQEHGSEYAPYVCSKDGCGKRYFTVNSLNSHGRIHQHPEEVLRCSYCLKVFEQPCRLKAHINMHIGVKPYVCDFEGCTWAFTTSSKLRRHQRKHTQTRKHVCKVCSKSFLRAEHLKDHSLKHFVKKSFICPISGCGTVFSNKSSMYAHLKKHRNQDAKTRETELTSYPCPMDASCHLVFNTKESLRTHIQLYHALSGFNNENTQDSIQMLSDDNLITLDGLPGNTPSSGPGVVSFNAMSQEGLLVGMSDLVQCIPVMEQGDFSESDSSNNIISVVFTDDLRDDESQVIEEDHLNLTEAENIGSARTGIPYQAGTKDKQPLSLAELVGQSTVGLHSASDVVLSSGLLAGHDNLERGLLLHDELSSGDLYPSQEESGGLLGNVGELQVLLLDPSTREQTSEFEQSTINLRDLE